MAACASKTEGFRDFAPGAASSSARTSAAPAWQTRDGSKVVGRREAGATVDPTAIDRLRLSTVSTTEGRLGETTFIQRIETAGGLAPAAAESDATTAGRHVEIT